MLSTTHNDNAIPQQQTLARSFTLRGIGLHTGADCRVHVHPAEPNSGRIFVSEGIIIPASVEYVVDTDRCTALGFTSARVRTVEHLLAALAGCHIDNAVIEVFGPEIPILDGSSLPFVQAIIDAGACRQGLLPNFIKLANTLTISTNGGASSLCATPDDAWEVCVETSFPGWPEGDAVTSMKFDVDSQMFIDEIAPARTFAFADEVEPLLNSGLARGGSLDNVIIITPPDTFSSELRLPGEWWRHKILDLVGDLALTNARLACSVQAVRPGHAINTQLAAMLVGDQSPRRREA